MTRTRTTRKKPRVRPLPTQVHPLVGLYYQRFVGDKLWQGKVTALVDGLVFLHEWPYGMHSPIGSPDGIRVVTLAALLAEDLRFKRTHKQLLADYVRYYAPDRRAAASRMERRGRSVDQASRQKDDEHGD